MKFIHGKNNNKQFSKNDLLEGLALKMKTNKKQNKTNNYNEKKKRKQNKMGHLFQKGKAGLTSKNQ